VTKRASPEALLLLGERILALWDVSEGMAHLHHHKILYRDLKTENVGRTVRSKVKDDNGASPMFQNFDHRDQQRMQIFDFGLAKECKPTDRVSQYPIGRDSHCTDSADADSFYDTYKTTGMTGTMRIMAPEVIKCLAYGLPVDVYSFGICMWEIFTGTKCNFLSAAEICDTKHTVRPKLPEAFDTTENGSVGMPKMLQRLMQACWHENPGKRPSFCEISKILRSSLAELYRQSLGLREQQRQPPQQELQRNRTSPFLSKGINEGCNENGAGGLWKNINKPQKQKQQQQQQEWHTTLDGGLKTADLLSDQAGFWYRLEAIRASGLLDD
jgi:serine/threonine protein kinase